MTNYFDCNFIYKNGATAVADVATRLLRFVPFCNANNLRDSFHGKYTNANMQSNEHYDNNHKSKQCAPSQNARSRGIRNH